MPSTTKSSKSAIVIQVRGYIAGINSEIPNQQSFPLEGQNIPRTSLLALFQSLLDADANTSATNATWRTAVDAENAILEQVKPLCSALKGALESQYGKSSPKLLKFGLTPAQPPVKTVAAKMVGVAKSANTRKLRGTTTKEAKAALQGQVPATITVTTGPSPRVVTQADAAVAAPPGTGTPGTGTPKNG
jgi:hypothetical protein